MLSLLQTITLLSLYASPPRTIALKGNFPKETLKRANIVFLGITQIALTRRAWTCPSDPIYNNRGCPFEYLIGWESKEWVRANQMLLSLFLSLSQSNVDISVTFSQPIITEWVDVVCPVRADACVCYYDYYDRRSRLIPFPPALPVISILTSVPPIIHIYIYVSTHKHKYTQATTVTVAQTPRASLIGSSRYECAFDWLIKVGLCIWLVD